MSSPTVAKRRFRFTLRTLLITVTALSILLGVITAVYRWQAVRSQERQARHDLHPYGGVYSMASALYSIRTGGQSKSWFFVTFMNYVEAVDLSPHNWCAMERRGKILPVDDDALAMLYSFRKLRTLDLRDTRVTDKGVRHIRTLTGLKQLDIRGTRITENGLQELRRTLPHCEISR